MRSFKNFRDQAVVVDLLKQQGFIQNEKPNEVLQTLGYKCGKLFIQRDDSDLGLQEWQRDVNNKVYENMKFSNNELGLFKIRESQIQEIKEETKIEILKNIFQGISNFQGVYNLVNFLYFYNKNVTNFEIFDQSAFFEIVSISFHPFKNLIAVATPFKILFYNLDLQDFDFNKTLEFGLDSQILTVEYSPLSGFLAIGATDKFIVLDLDSEKSPQEVYSLKKPVESVSWAYDETFLCFVSRQNPIVYVYNLEFKQLIKLQRVCQVFTNVLCSPQGRYILAYDRLYKSQIRIWDVSNWECTYLQTDGQVQNVC